MAEMGDDGSVVEDVITLLSSPKRNFLLSGKGVKVPISELQGKVVGLYFYAPWSDEDDFRKLKEMCEGLRKKGENNFQLVFICLHHRNSKKKKSVEKRFRKNFDGTNWLALPFSQRKTNKKLYELFSSLGNPYACARLVIILPGENMNINIAHTYAMHIYTLYGIEAYPFSKSRVTDIEVARLKSLTLHFVLFYGVENKYVIGQRGQKIRPSYLVGKNVILFLTTQPIDDSVDDDPDARRDKLINEKVISWYNEIKRNDESFEMVRVFYVQDQTLESATESYDEKMPWLEVCYDNKPNVETMYGVLFKTIGNTYTKLPMFVAFGRDGQFITLTSIGTLIDSSKDDDGCPDFFDDVNLYRDVHNYIAMRKMWSLEGEETGSSSLQRCSSLQRNATEGEETGSSSLQRCSGLQQCNAKDMDLSSM